MGNMGSACYPEFGCLSEPTYYPFGCNPALSTGSAGACDFLLPANEGTLNSQGYSYAYLQAFPPDITACGNTPMCNKNTAIDDDWHAYYGYVNFFLITLSIVVGCPFLGWGWSKLTRPDSYKPGGGYGVAGL
ncbi:hypothetical protein TrLO_g13625 [Triparma laevis f. longispina]|uniref:Uncharacterized protein n=1 Tax=Triparma laevis f. longispina TaxID=1714387 RepID=A0A9W7DZH1_9STRA|nr:hypothetical protein TrLO_g13625 [Triparma laevis f. longispina]